MKKRLEELKQMLGFVIDDLQMLELDNVAYGEAFEQAVALKALVESIESTRRGGNGEEPVVYQ